MDISILTITPMPTEMASANYPRYADADGDGFGELPGGSGVADKSSASSRLARAPKAPVGLAFSRASGQTQCYHIQLDSWLNNHKDS
jgi:hypothetical protein